MGNLNTHNGSTKRSSFSDNYISGELLGSSEISKVKRCIRKYDKKQFAVKIVDRRHITGRELVGLKEEIRILKNINFPHIIKLSDVFGYCQTKIIFELCEGGDLFDQILKTPKHRFDERKSAIITCTLTRSLKYLHDHYIVHRDLKPENILFTKEGILKIIHFGLASYRKYGTSLHVMRTCCGSPHYVAPEVLTNNTYSHQIDYWSLGVILYIMLCGYQPFNSHSIQNMYRMIIRGEYKFPSPVWDDISDEAKDLVTKLMCIDYNKRYTADEIMKHKWIIKHIQNVNSLNVASSLYYIDLLIFGYIHEYETKFKMNIPNDLIIIIIKYYSYLLSFGLFNKNIFQISENGKRIKGRNENHNDCNGYLVYASFGDKIKSFSKGIHRWSVKYNQPRRFHEVWNEMVSIGITPFLSEGWINGQHCDSWKSIWSDNYDCVHWKAKQKENGWKLNEIISIKLDCDNGEVVFYKENIEIKHESIQPHIPYYFAIFLCGDQHLTDFEIVEHPTTICMNC